MTSRIRSTIRTRLRAASPVLLLACGGPGARDGGSASPPPGLDPGPPAPASPQPTATPQPPATPRPDASGILLSFLLDPRSRGGGSYGGDIWVSPATYTGAATQDTVEARASGVGANGGPVPIGPDWIPSDPAMVSVSPRRGAQVTIAVRRPGESRIEVRWQAASRTLVVRATSDGARILQLEIVQ